MGVVERAEAVGQRGVGTMCVSRCASSEGSSEARVRCEEGDGEGLGEDAGRGREAARGGRCGAWGTP